MNVAELTNDQLAKAITGRLRAGELDLLLREAGRRDLKIEIAYNSPAAAGMEGEEIALKLRISFERLLAETDL